jgi:hypothetical protein
MAKTELHDRVRDEDIGAVEALLKGGANVNARDSNGRTALHQGAALGAADIVDLLLAHGADASAVNKSKETALHEVANSEVKVSDKDRVRIVTSLLDAGCPLELTGLPKATALYYAAWEGHLAIVRALLARGADPNPKESPLQAAKENGHKAVAQVLLAAGTKSGVRKTAEPEEADGPENPLRDRARIDAGKRAKGRENAEYLGRFTSDGGSLGVVLMSATRAGKYGGPDDKNFRNVLRSLKKPKDAALELGGGDALAVDFGDNPSVHVLRLGSGDIVLMPSHYYAELEEKPDPARWLDVLSSGPIGKLTKIGSARLEGNAATLLWVHATAHELDDRAIDALTRKSRTIGGKGTPVGLAFALPSGRYSLWREASSGSDDGYSSCYWLTSSGRAPALYR